MDSKDFWKDCSNVLCFDTPCSCTQALTFVMIEKAFKTMEENHKKHQEFNKLQRNVAYKFYDEHGRVPTRMELFKAVDKELKNGSIS